MPHEYKVESKRIGAHLYTVTQLNAVTGRKALLRLVKIVGPAFAEGMKGGQLAGYTTVAQTLSETELDYFCDLLAGQTTVSGGDYSEDAEPQLDKVFASHFADNYFEMFEWLAFALEVNFGSFFLGLAKKFAGMAKAGEIADTSSDSPNT